MGAYGALTGPILRSQGDGDTLLRGNDSLYSSSFRGRVAQPGIQSMLCAPTALFYYWILAYASMSTSITTAYFLTPHGFPPLPKGTSTRGHERGNDGYFIFVPLHPLSRE
jgi:hypothetical protein